MTTPFWLNQPSILFKQNHISEVWPLPHMSMTEKLNAISRLVIMLTVLGFFISRSIKVLVTGIITLASLVLLFFIQAKRSPPIMETFTNMDLYDMIRDGYTEPSTKNPLMNVLLPEINDNPERNPAAPAFSPRVEQDINKSIKEMVCKQFNDPYVDERLFKDLGDNFDFDRSMRQFYATANTTIPDDQKAFADFCYGDMISCRDITNNELACTRNMPPRWQNV